MKEEFEQKLKPIPVAEDSSNQSTKKTEEQKCSSSTNNAEVLTKAVPDSKPQTPMTPLSEIKGNESPSLNKVTVPTPLGLQDTNVCMRSVGTSSRESIRKKTSSKQGADFKKSEPVPPISDAETQVEMDPSNKPKTPLQDTGSLVILSFSLSVSFFSFPLFHLTFYFYLFPYFSASDYLFLPLTFSCSSSFSSFHLLFIFYTPSLTLNPSFSFDFHSLCL
ncbi:CREB1 [Acanthosepion pharaonis]|uniref:CREB1 n=1 Tax=Acanthosepion pharaonis TaxID=158019 RepID=A0A812CIV7_ACAPH|nr:CREB1 [Sepia pharaonis]